MQDEPRGLLGDAYLLAQLQAADALASGHKQIHGIQPLVQRDVATLEYRASAHREGFNALVTAVVTIGARCDAVSHAADRTAAAVRPQTLFEIRPRRLCIGKHGEQLVSADGDFVVHLSSFARRIFKISSHANITQRHKYSSERLRNSLSNNRKLSLRQTLCLALPFLDFRGAADCFRHDANQIGIHRCNRLNSFRAPELLAYTSNYRDFTKEVKYHFIYDKYHNKQAGSYVYNSQGICYQVDPRLIPTLCSQSSRYEEIRTARIFRYSDQRNVDLFLG